MDRLYLSFKGTMLSVSEIFVSVFAIIFGILMILSSIWHTYNIIFFAYDDKSENGCLTNYDFTLSVVPGLFVDFIFNFILLCLFVKSLTKLIRINTCTLGLQEYVETAVKNEEKKHQVPPLSRSPLGKAQFDHKQQLHLAQFQLSQTHPYGNINSNINTHMHSNSKSKFQYTNYYTKHRKDNNINMYTVNCVNSGSINSPVSNDNDNYNEIGSGGSNSPIIQKSPTSQLGSDLETPAQHVGEEDHDQEESIKIIQSKDDIIDFAQTRIDISTTVTGRSGRGEDGSRDVIEANRDLSPPPSPSPGMRSLRASISLTTEIIIRKGSDVALDVKTKAKFAKERSDMRLIGVITKLTVLTSVHITASVFALMVLSYFVLPIVAICFDVWINSICALYCFDFYKKEYSKYCCYCNKIAFYCCAWMIFTYDDGDNDNHNEKEPQKECQNKNEDKNKQNNNSGTSAQINIKNQKTRKPKGTKRKLSRKQTIELHQRAMQIANET